MNINYLMGLCAVAASVGVAVKIISSIAVIYPLPLFILVVVLIVAVVAARIFLYYY